MKQEEKKQYDVKCFRLHDKTTDRLKKERIKSGKSWNRFFIELLDKYGKNKM